MQLKNDPQSVPDTQLSTALHFSLEPLNEKLLCEGLELFFARRTDLFADLGTKRRSFFFGADGKIKVHGEIKVWIQKLIKGFHSLCKSLLNRL
jgi:hypothetical protein